MSLTQPEAICTQPSLKKEVAWDSHPRLNEYCQCRYPSAGIACNVQAPELASARLLQRKLAAGA